MSPVGAGSLLEQFARLAASVTQTSAAVIELLGRQSDPAPVRAEFGPAPHDAGMVARIDAILQRGVGLTVLPDLMQDARFANAGQPSGSPRPRFLAHQTLLSPGRRTRGLHLRHGPGCPARID